jgi:NADP-dependent 3-hydroxy acid dehydrogenase YdfG
MGKSHVRHFVAEGAQVVFGDVLDDKGAAVAAGLDERCCRYVHHDVTSEAGWATAVATAVDTFDRLDVLVNNAGVLAFATIADMPLAEFRRILEVNAVGCWLGMKAVIEPMKAAGGGSIINISSIEGFTGAAGLSAYSASKFAVRGMTKACAWSSIWAAVASRRRCPRGLSASRSEKPCAVCPTGSDPCRTTHSIRRGCHPRPKVPSLTRTCCAPNGMKRCSPGWPSCRRGSANS